MKNTNDQNFFNFFCVGGLYEGLNSKDVYGLNYMPLSCFFAEFFQKPIFQRNIIDCIIIVTTFYITIIFYLFLLI